jgi:hypothetical protein
VVALTVFGVLCYVLSLRVVASVVERHFSWLPFSDLYLHEPSRLRYGVLLVLPLLAATGLDRWREAPDRRTQILIAGVLAYGLLALVGGAEPIRLALPVAGVIAGIAVLALSRTRPALIGVVPALLAMELSINGFIGKTFPGGEVPSRVQPPILNVPFTPLARPRFSIADYLEPGPIAARLRSQDDRFISLDPSRLTERGYLEHQGPASWPLLANQRATLFGLEDGQGYNPVQLRTYWKFVRAVEPKDIKYNAAFFVEPSSTVLDLLDVAWIIARSPPAPEAASVGSDGLWSLYHVAVESPRASLVSRWKVVDSSEAALAAITDPAFDASSEAVLERDPGLPEGGGGSQDASYDDLGPGRARITVDTTSAGILLVRNSHDTNWRARLDGEPVSVFRADAFLQAVAVPGGRHVIELDYVDPWVGRGLLGSGLSVGGLAGAGFWMRRRSSRRRLPAPQGEKGSGEGRQAGHDPGEARRERAADDGKEQEP